MSAVGVERTWDLRGYTGDGLALLTGRKRAYGYQYTEAFLSQLAKASGGEPDNLTQFREEESESQDEHLVRRFEYRTTPSIRSAILEVHHSCG